MAEAGAEPGRVYWDLVAGVLRIAVVLAPDRPIADDTLADLMLLVAFDTLATLAPPQVPVSTVLPGTLLLDGGRVGTVRTALGPVDVPPGNVPRWAMAGLQLTMTATTTDPGLAPELTSLQEEGFGTVTAADVLEQVCRHLLVWVDTWRHPDAGGGPDALSRAVAHRMHVLDDLQERT